jgi:hypothetical protein
MVLGNLPPAEGQVICGLLSAIAWAEGRLSLEEELFLQMVAEELGVAVGSRDSVAGTFRDARLLSETARTFSANAALVFANIGGDCLPRRRSTLARVLGASATRPDLEQDALSHARAARQRIDGATVDFLHSVGKISGEPLATYLHVVGQLESHVRQSLRESIGLDATDGRQGLPHGAT